MAVRVGLGNIGGIDLDRVDPTPFQKCKNWFKDHKETIKKVAVIALNILIIAAYFTAEILFELGKIGAGAYLGIALPSIIFMFAGNAIARRIIGH